MALKRGLGKGLDAILQKPTAPVAGVRELPITSLKPNRHQPRTNFDAEGLEELADSIRAQGVIQPLVVMEKAPGNFIIVAGERRWRAAGKAGLQTVPVFVRDVADDRQLLELALVENLQRADLNAIEEAEAYKTLRENFALSQEEIAGRVGRSRPAVTNTLRLLRLPPAVQDLLRSGQLSAGQARPLVGMTDAERQIALAQRIVEEGLSARQVEAAARPAEAVEKRGKKSKSESDVHTRAAEERLTRCLQTRVEIRRRKKGGEVKIHFHSEDELQRLYEVLLEGSQG